jgi:mediator of RNA polymerase II transcription subunit 17
LSQLAQSAQPGLITATTEQRTAALTATVVTGQPEIVPVQAYNAQLVVSGKDEGLRGAASVLRTAAADVERGQAADEQYWVDALKLRRANWGLMPAPLPFGTANIRAPDRPATDFLVSCGLEEGTTCLTPFLKSLP